MNVFYLRRYRMRGLEGYQSAAAGVAPGRGESFRTPMHDDERGIRFEVEKMVHYADYFSGDPLVVQTARRIVEMCKAKDKLCEMAALFHWVKKHYRYVSDPVNREAIETPVRMIEDIQTPPEVLQAILGEDLIQQMKGFGVGYRILAHNRCVMAESCFRADGKIQPRTSEDCDSGATFLATLFAAVGIVPRFRFGGNRGGRGACNYHHVWVQGQGPGGDWVDFDVTEASSKPGWFWPHFECYGYTPIFQNTD